MTTLRLVPLTREHAEPMHATLADPEVLRFTRTPDPVPEGWFETWVTDFDGVYSYAWAILDRDEFVGYAVTGPVNHPDHELELGYAVAPWARGRGVATETLRLLTAWAFELGMLRVTALVSVDNPASSRVVAKVGYTLEGVLRSVHHKLGRRGDLQSWSILPGELDEEPDEAGSVAS